MSNPRPETQNFQENEQQDELMSPVNFRNPIFNGFEEVKTRDLQSLFEEH